MKYPLKYCLFIGLLFVACAEDLDKDSSKQTTMYCYEIQENGNKIKEVFKIVSWMDGVKHQVRDSIVDIRTGKEEVRTMRYQKSEDGYLYKALTVDDQTVKKPYLSLKKNEKVNFNHRIPELSTTIEYLGDTVMDIEGKKVKARKFIKSTGIVDGVVTELVLDSNLVLLKETYLEGLAPSFVIQRKSCH